MRRMDRERLFVPPTVTCSKEAYQYVKVSRGTTVYLMIETGDYNIQAQRSVTLHPGHEGVIDEVYLSDDIWWKIRIKITDPPAQPFLIWGLEDFTRTWTMDPTMFPKPTEPLRQHERAELDLLGQLMG